MSTRPLNSKSLSQMLNGRQVLQAVLNGQQQLSIEFTDGARLIVEAGPNGLRTQVTSTHPASPQNDPAGPTQRQLDYLTFIAKYIQRFGRSPAEADIGRHFMVSAPSVNAMVQTLERRGFITRQAGVPRSIRICHHVEPV